MKYIIPSINFHLWQPCNMKCKYCFGKFDDVKKTVLPKGHLPKERSIELIKQFAKFGFKKITFVGGEPTLCNWLPELVILAKSLKMTTAIVTNGSMLNQKYIDLFQNSLDWVTLSIDTLTDEEASIVGRTVNRIPINLDYYKYLCLLIKKNNIKLKINTVVSRVNYQADFSKLIITTSPDRWKVFQVLPIKGQNSFTIDDFLINSTQFNEFIDSHIFLKNILNINVVFEDNYLMTGSYIMVDPAGRFFDNISGKYKYSPPILEVGIKNAIESITYYKDRFYNRDGIYDWERK